MIFIMTVTEVKQTMERLEGIAKDIENTAVDSSRKTMYDFMAKQIRDEIQFLRSHLR